MVHIEYPDRRYSDDYNVIYYDTGPPSSSIPTWENRAWSFGMGGTGGAVCVCTARVTVKIINETLPLGLGVGSIVKGFTRRRRKQPGAWVNSCTALQKTGKTGNLVQFPPDSISLTARKKYLFIAQSDKTEKSVRREMKRGLFLFTRAAVQKIRNRNPTVLWGVQ